MNKIIICNKNFDKKKIRNLIEWFLSNYGSIRTLKLIEEIKKKGIKFSTKAGISIGTSDLIIPRIKETLIENTIKKLKKNNIKLEMGRINKLQNNEKIIETWSIINETLKKEIIKNFKQTDLLNPIYIMILSGARGNLSQIKQLIGMRGLMSDSKGEIINIPITNNLKEGLNSNDYFISCYGARKGIIDTALKTANSGYLTRKLIYASQSIIIKQPDCLTRSSTLIKVKKSTKEEYNNTKEKLLGRVLAENIKNINTKNVISSKKQDICNYVAKKIIKLKKNIFIKTILDCKLKLSVCQLCYGWNLTNNKIVNLGEPIGILAAQSIGEPGTQLTMRTFHTGGIFKTEIKKVIQTPIKGIIKYTTKNLKKIITKQGDKAFLIKKEKNFYIQKKKLNIMKIKIPKFSTILIKNKKRIFKHQIIAEIPKWKRQKKIKKKKINKIETIKAKNSGKIIINKTNLWLINGHALKNKKNKETILTFYNKKTYSTINEPKISLYTKTKKIKIYLKKKLKLINKNINKKNKKNRKLNYNIKVTTKNNMVLTNKLKNQKIILLLLSCKKKIGGFIKLNKKNKIKYRGQITEIRENFKIIKKALPYFISENSNLNVKNNQLIEKNKTIFNLIYKKEKTKDIVEGLPKIEEILEAKKKEKKQVKIKRYLDLYKKKLIQKNAINKVIKKIQLNTLKKIQKVYTSQDVKLAEKHIEVVIREMTSKAIIKNIGESNFITGELVDIKQIEKINKYIKKKIIYEPIVLGISQIPKFSNSFVSGICFQETTRLLIKSAISGKIDWLKGLKENIIIGNLIPTGTGYITKV